jgi:hypothetical protein
MKDEKIIMKKMNSINGMINYIFHISRFVISIVLVFAMSGCNPYEFHMGGPHIVDAVVITGLHGVDQGGYVATLRDTAAVDLNYYGATQYLISMGIVLKRGEGFRIMLRPVVEQHDVKDSGIIVTATRSGVWLDSSRQIFINRPDVAITQDELVHVELWSENNYMQVVLNCDTVFRGWSHTKESDDIVVQALESSEIQLIDPDWAALPDHETAYTLHK